MPLHLYNTLTRRVEEFSPLHPPQVGLYTCGPTVYNFAHIGNLRTYVFEDILKRTLLASGYQVNHVMNITDVGHLTSDADEGEDKLEKGSRREGKSAWDIAEFYTRAFEQDLAALNIVPPTTWCKATDHISEQIALVQTLIDKGFTYTTTDGIYFDTTKLADYGKLALLQRQQLSAGARVDMGEKKDAHDFALWKFTPAKEQRQMEWEAFGHKGFPGWHIECSAMATKYLGQPFDIHCGGIDHVPVHHTNEIAQSEAAYSVPLANYWLHGEFLVVPSGDKMAKSGDNFLTIASINQKNISPLAYRYLLLQTHYRKQLAFSWEALEAASTGYERLKHVVAEIENSTGAVDQTAHAKFLQLISNDLDTPAALALAWEVARGDLPSAVKRATLLEFDRVLGLNLEKKSTTAPIVIPENVQTLLTARAEARQAKNFAASDRLRDEIRALGYIVEDTPTGQICGLI